MPALYVITSSDTGLFFFIGTEKRCKRSARSASPAIYAENRAIFADLADDADLFQGFPESEEKKKRHLRGICTGHTFPRSAH